MAADGNPKTDEVEIQPVEIQPMDITADTTTSPFPFQGYLEQVQQALQRQIEGGASPGEVGKKIFESILGALESQGDKPQAQREAPPDPPETTVSVATDAQPVAATPADIPKNNEDDDDSVGVLVTAPPSYLWGIPGTPEVPSISEITKGLQKIGQVLETTATKVAETAVQTVKDVKAGAQAAGNAVVDVTVQKAKDMAGGAQAVGGKVVEFGKEHGKEMVNDVAKAVQGGEQTGGSWDSGTFNGPDITGGTVTLEDLE